MMIGSSAMYFLRPCVLDMIIISVSKGVPGLRELGEDQASGLEKEKDFLGMVQRRCAFGWLWRYSKYELLYLGTTNVTRRGSGFREAWRAVSAALFSSWYSYSGLACSDPSMGYE